MSQQGRGQPRSSSYPVGARVPRRIPQAQAPAGGKQRLGTTTLAPSLLPASPGAILAAQKDGFWSHLLSHSKTLPESSWGRRGAFRMHVPAKFSVKKKKKKAERGKEELLKETQSADHTRAGGWTRLHLGLLNHGAKWFPLHLTGEQLLCSTEKVSCSNKQGHNGESIH